MSARRKRRVNAKDKMDMVRHDNIFVYNQIFKMTHELQELEFGNFRSKRADTSVRPYSGGIDCVREQILSPLGTYRHEICAVLGVIVIFQMNFFSLWQIHAYHLFPPFYHTPGGLQTPKKFEQIIQNSCNPFYTMLK